jgi:uncharacterized membrane protein
MWIATSVIAAVILMFISYIKPFELKKEKSLIALLLPCIATLFLLSSIFTSYGNILIILFLISIFAGIAYYVYFNDKIFGFFPVNNDFQALICIFFINLFGVIVIVLTEDFSQFGNNKVLALFIGIFAIIFARSALLSLAAQRVKNSNKTLIFSILSAFGFIGTLIVYLFTKPKE